MALLVRYHKELEHDFLALGVDILDVWRGEVSLRRCRVLIDTLPPGSALLRSFSDDDGWGVTDYLLAQLIDVAMIGNWLQTDTKKSKKPKRFPRPSDMRRTQAIADEREERARRHIQRQLTGG